MLECEAPTFARTLGALLSTDQPRTFSRSDEPLPFPSTLAALGLAPERDVAVVQLFVKGCRPCADEVPALAAVSGRVQLVSLGLHEGAALTDAAASLGITWTVKPLPAPVADALSTAGALPLPLLLVYQKGVLTRVLPGPRALEAVLAD